jgi:hypothetical protein
MISLRRIVVTAIDRAENKSTPSASEVELHNSELSVIPDLNRTDMRKLEDKGIHTLRELRALRIEDHDKIGLSREKLEFLKSTAKLLAVGIHPLVASTLAS